jgi:hypothetical protein
VSEWICGACGATIASVFHNCPASRTMRVHPEAENFSTMSAGSNAGPPKKRRAQRRPGAGDTE